MKKNFLMVAALLIAAMLMVVSCSQEVAPKNEDNKGPVEVMLNTSVASKSLSFGNTLESASGLTYKYYLTALWDKTLSDEAVVGETTEDGEVFSVNDSGTNLGYLSQGYWKIVVKGFNAANKEVLYGETNHYVTAGKGNITVFLNTSGDGLSTSVLKFDINVNDLADGSNGYDLYYSISGTDYERKPFTVEETKIENKKTVTSIGDTKPTYITKFTGEKSGLKPGYYRVTVTLKNNTSVIGGITRGFLLVNGDSEVTLSGSVSASDFVKSNLKVITPSVVITSVSAKVGNGSDLLTKEGDSYKGDVTGATEENKVSVTYSVESTFSISNNTEGVVSVGGPTYSWQIDGKEVATSKTFTQEYAPGNRHATCFVTYTYKCKVGETETEFAVTNEAYTYLTVKEN